MFSLQQNQRRRGRNRYVRKHDGGDVAQTMHTRVSKCKNDRIKGEKKKKTMG
jgi:hypothetical protein